MTEDSNVVLEEGAQIVADPNQAIPMDMIGHVTSSYWSEALGRSVAMALVKDGFNRMDETLHIPMIGKTYTAKVSSAMFYDPKGSVLMLFDEGIDTPEDLVRDALTVELMPERVRYNLRIKASDLAMVKKRAVGNYRVKLARRQKRVSGLSLSSALMNGFYLMCHLQQASMRELLLNCPRIS